MKVIFLDLDGVLNHEDYFTKNSHKIKADQKWYEKYFCKETVEILNEITDKTKAKIVFSSSHRFRYDTLEELQKNMRLAGISAQEVVDKLNERINELQEKIQTKSNLQIPEMPKDKIENITINPLNNK